jgi:hypothetical protein
VADVGIRDEDLAERPHALIRREESLRVRRAPFAAQDDTQTAAQEALAPSRAGATRASASV